MKKNCKNTLLFLPFFYGFSSRARLTVHRISFFFLIIVPIFIHSYFSAQQEFNVLWFTLGFIAMYSVYEIGYIYNDYFTPTLENEETIWVSDQVLAFVKRWFPILISARVLLVSIFVLLLHMLDANNVIAFSIALVLLNLAFSFHNSLRGKVNVLSDSALQLLKYGSVLLLFSRRLFSVSILFIYIEIGLWRGIEYAIGKGYWLQRLQKFGIDRLRIVYHLLITCISLALFLTKIASVEFLVGSAYLLLYRMMTYVLSKSGSVAKQRMMNNSSIIYEEEQ